MLRIQQPQIRKHRTHQPNGDLGFTFKVIARANGVEINGHYVGPKEQGFASAAEHFGQHLTLLAAEDARLYQPRVGDRRYITTKGKEWLARHDAA